jgi:hypothetical protein
MKNPPQRKKCPECGKQGKRSIMAPNFRVANPTSKPKFKQSDYNNLLRESIEDTKQILDNQSKSSPYATYTIKRDHAERMGGKLMTEDDHRRVDPIRKRHAEAAENNYKSKNRKK